MRCAVMVPPAPTRVSVATASWPRQSVRPDARRPQAQQATTSRQEGLPQMTIADITLAVPTLCNTLRVFAYVPRIAEADRSAEAMLLRTWGLFLVLRASAIAYALVS